MVVEEEALQEEGMVAVAVAVEADMEGARNRIMEAFWSEIFLLIAGLDFILFIWIKLVFYVDCQKIFMSVIGFCRPEELRVPFERFGVVRDVYIPKDYYTG